MGEVALRGRGGRCRRSEWWKECRQLWWSSALWALPSRRHSCTPRRTVLLPARSRSSLLADGRIAVSLRADLARPAGGRTRSMRANGTLLRVSAESRGRRAHRRSRAARLRAGVALRLARALSRHLGDRRARGVAYRTDRARSGGARAEPAPSAHPGERDRNARAPRSGPDRCRDRDRFHRANGDGSAGAHVGLHAALHRAAARAAARRSRWRSTARSCKCCTATASHPSGPIATPIVVAANGPKGMEVAARARRRGDDRRRRRAVVQLVLGARSSEPCSTTASSPARIGRWRPRVRRSPSCTTRCTKVIRLRSTACRAVPSGGRGRGGPRTATSLGGARGSSRPRHRPRPAAPERRPVARVHLDRHAPPTCAPGWSRSRRRE